jgi:beta-galactosidase
MVIRDAPASQRGDVVARQRGRLRQCVFPHARAPATRPIPEKRLIQYADMNLAADFDSQTYPDRRVAQTTSPGKAIRKGEKARRPSRPSTASTRPAGLS